MTPKFRILVIDDDKDSREMAAGALEEKYEVVMACDGVEALEKLERSQPDFVIIDMVMPKMDGLQTCQAIRRTPLYATIPIMFLSAHSTREQILKSYECGGNLFLPKPIDPERLIRNVDIFFESSHSAPRMKTVTIERLKAIDEKANGHDTGALKRMPSSKMQSDAPVSPISPHPISPSQTTSDEAHGESPMKPRILLAEDDKDLVELILMALSPYYEMIVTNNGLEAIEKMVKYQPDILLVDVMLPKMNGYQLCQSVRSNSAFVSVPIVFITAKCTPREKEYAMKLGADAFLGKPFEMHDLVKVCEEIATDPHFRPRRKKMSFAEVRFAETAPERTKKQVYEPETKWKD